MLMPSPDGRENPFYFSIATGLNPWQLKNKKIGMTAGNSSKKN
jgi:hypothetical protein